MKPVKLFGILNVTPDSFSDGGKFFDSEKAVRHVEKMFVDGADYVDVGGQSTRPNAEEISWEEEWKRVEPVLKRLFVRDRYICPLRGKISLDTFHWQTAKKFLTFGGKILNDVSGFQDPKMRDLSPKFEMIVVNHFPGRTVIEVHEQKINSLNQVCDELLERKAELIKAGVKPENIILDPGIGFGKTMELNWELLEFAKLVPRERVMIGYSRKRFLGEQRFEIEPNLKAAKIAVASGAQFLRVHDVKEVYEMTRSQDNK